MLLYHKKLRLRKYCQLDSLFAALYTQLRQDLAGNMRYSSMF